MMMIEVCATVVVSSWTAGSLDAASLPETRLRSGLVDQKRVFIFRGAGGNRHGELIWDCR
jgi:hypothetical protein